MKETNTAAAAAANAALTAVVISARNAINLPFPTDNPGAICRRWPGVGDVSTVA